MNSIKKLAGFLGVVGISSLLTLPGLAEVNLNQSAKNSLLLAQNSPGQSTTNPTNNRGSSGSTGVNAVDDPCVREGINSDRGSSSTSANARNSSTSANSRNSSNANSRNSSTTANARNSSGSTSYPSADDQSLTAQNQRCLEQESDNSSSDSTITPGTRNTPSGSTIRPGTRNTPGGSTTTPGSGTSQ